MEDDYKDYVKSELRMRLDELLSMENGCPYLLGVTRQRTAEVHLNEIIDDLFFEAAYEDL